MFDFVQFMRGVEKRQFADEMEKTKSDYLAMLKTNPHAEPIPWNTYFNAHRELICACVKKRIGATFI